MSIFVEHTLDYAPVSLPGASRRWAFAATAMTLSVVGATLAVYGAADGALDYMGTFGGCATGRSEAGFQLQILTPLAFSLPAVGWLVASRVGTGVLVCRASLWAAVTAWLTACICVFN